jgi:hypothetical protein
MDRRLIFRHPRGEVERGEDAVPSWIGALDLRAARPTAFDLEVQQTYGHEKPPEDDPPARTAIRHRCARRASEGVRENPREGTRQNDPVPSVQGVLIPRGVSRRESGLATVYQKHRTLPTRKRTYRV